MDDKSKAYKYLNDKCITGGYESLGDFIGCQTTDTIATCVVAWCAGYAGEQADINIEAKIKSVDRRESAIQELSACSGCAHECKMWTQKPCIDCGHTIKGRSIKYEEIKEMLK